ncbi:response regulator [Lyngbya confervoides]|uniref:Response regulator n=1 Tax=Lyngbya confervoides BDU141951 TaxID=1574623 RepID=A0ABD4T2S7_9CYAN|nr:response regulator [Lyngbya confervoides]MCM1982755.1 response regulator [Lyngbya confervoides BDU141951]
MTSHKILVIDDSKVIRMRVREMLPEGDFEVLEAKDGLEGLNLIREQRPNLIMLDFLLPRLSGWDVYQELQQDQDLQKIPLVIMSGRKEEVTDKISEPFAYFEFIEKPFEKYQLQTSIKAAISKSKLPRLRKEPATVGTGVLGFDPAEIEGLKEQIEKMQAEINALKRAMTQLVGIVKEKL